MASSETPGVFVVEDSPSPPRTEEHGQALMTDILSDDTPMAMVEEGCVWPPVGWHYSFQRLPSSKGSSPCSFDVACLGLKGSVEKVDFSCAIQTMILLIGRDNLGPVVGERTFTGCRSLVLHSDDAFTFTVLRPLGLPSFEEMRWHPFDLTRIGFLGMKKLSRTHFAISWTEEGWSVTSLSTNGITINEAKLQENGCQVLNAGDTISASGGLLRLCVSMVGKGK